MKSLMFIGDLNIFELSICHQLSPPSMGNFHPVKFWRVGSPLRVQINISFENWWFIGVHPTKSCNMM
jgi:hypothetical protein